MSAPTREAMLAALATVNDPEIRKPLTELGMVKSVVADDAGHVLLELWLTVAVSYTHLDVYKRQPWVWTNRR